MMTLEEYLALPPAARRFRTPPAGYVAPVVAVSAGTRPGHACVACDGRGYTESTRHCTRCRGTGWVMPR